MYDEFGFYEDIFPDPPEESADGAAAPNVSRRAAEEASATIEPHVPIRHDFPPAGADYLGGSSDGWEYRTVFGGSKLAYSFEMVKQFLQEEGYADLPLPQTADELKLFKRPRPGQQALFGERGYVHNPIKILFPTDPKLRNALILCVYNEKVEGHLLKFHGLQ